jgi:predicted metal-binding protein
MTLPIEGPASAGSEPVRLMVCTTCRATGADADAPRPGAQLLAALGEALATEGEAGAHVIVEPVECLSVCKRPCTVSITAPGRWTYVYGDVDAAAHAGPLIAFAAQYQATADGLVPWRERPEFIRKGVVARIPPLVRAAP